MEAAGQEGLQGRLTAAVAGAEGQVAVVEEQSFARTGAAADDAPADIGGEDSGIAEQLEELQAEGFAGLLVDGLDGEEGGDLDGIETVGVEDPEGEEVALVLGAVEVASDEAGEIVEQGGAIDGLGGFGLLGGGEAAFNAGFLDHGLGDAGDPGVIGGDLFEFLNVGR